VQSDLLQ